MDLPVCKGREWTKYNYDSVCDSSLQTPHATEMKIKQLLTCQMHFGVLVVWS